MFGFGVDVEIDCNDWPGLVVFFLLGVVVEYPLLISSHNPMQKNLFFVVLNQLFASKKSPFNVSRFQFIRLTQFPCFWIIPMALNRAETVCWVTPNDSASSSCVWLWSSLSNASNSLSSNFFGCPERGLSSTLKSPSSKRRNHSLLWFRFSTWFSWSSVTINFKHSMGFSCTFLPIKTEN